MKPDLRLLAVAASIAYGFAADLYAQQSSPPAGAVFLLERVPVVTRSGVIGMNAGTAVQVVSQKGDVLRVTDGVVKFDVSSDKVTNDPALGAARSREDRAAQQAIAERMRQQNAVYQQAQIAENARQAEELRVIEEKRRAVQRPKPIQPTSFGEAVLPDDDTFGTQLDDFPDHSARDNLLQIEAAERRAESIRQAERSEAEERKARDREEEQQQETEQRQKRDRASFDVQNLETDQFLSRKPLPFVDRASVENTVGNSVREAKDPGVENRYQEVLRKDDELRRDEQRRQEDDKRRRDSDGQSPRY